MLEHGTALHQRRKVAFQILGEIDGGVAAGAEFLLDGNIGTAARVARAMKRTSRQRRLGCPVR